MSAITTHVLDTSRGRPAAGIHIILESQEEGERWLLIWGGRTDEDGRLQDWLPAGHRLSAGTYRLTFETAAYFAAQGVESFYPFVQIVFVVRDASEHHHVPLLLSPFGYSTYRGS
jgi:5-hydroxyisourate hydrolase